MVNNRDKIRNLSGVKDIQETHPMVPYENPVKKIEDEIPEVKATEIEGRLLSNFANLIRQLSYIKGDCKDLDKDVKRLLHKKALRRLEIIKKVIDYLFSKNSDEDMEKEVKTIMMRIPVDRG